MSESAKINVSACRRTGIFQTQYFHAFPAAFFCIVVYALLPVFISLTSGIGIFPFATRHLFELLVLFAAILLCFGRIWVAIETLALFFVVTFLAVVISLQGSIYGIDVMITNRNWLWMFLQILVVYTVISSSKSLRNGRDAYRLLTWLVWIHILVLTAETALALAGLQPELARLFDGANNTSVYRTDLPSLVRYAVPWVSGLNSLAFGAQHASIAAVVGVVFFAPWLRNERFTRGDTLGLMMSLIVWAFSFTVTSFICLAGVAFFAVFIVRSSRFYRVWIKSVIFGVAILALAAPRLLLSWKIKSDSAWAEYVNAFRDPFVQVAKMDAQKLLLGVGKLASGEDPAGHYFRSHDFGWGVEVVRHGVPAVIIVAAALSILYWHTARSLSISKTPHVNFRATAISLSLAISLIHYPTLYANGFRQLFILATSLCLVELRNARLMRNLVPAD